MFYVKIFVRVNLPVFVKFKIEIIKWPPFENRSSKKVNIFNVVDISIESIHAELKLSTTTHYWNKYLKYLKNGS